MTLIKKNQIEAFNKNDVGLDNVDNIADANQTALGTVTSGNVDAIVTKSSVGLGNVDNTSDADKPVSTAQQTALDLKLDKAGGTMTGDIDMDSNKIINGTYNGVILDAAGVSTNYLDEQGNYKAVSKSDVGLANVDNTSDATKDAATATLTNKNLTSGTNTFPTFNQDTTGKSADTDALNSATTTVNVSSATAPTIGQVLTATSSTAATWQDTGGGGGGITDAFSVKLGTQQDFLAATLAKVNFDTEIYDVDANYNTTNKQYTAPTNGLYYFSANMFTNAVEVPTIQFTDGSGTVLGGSTINFVGSGNNSGSRLTNFIQLSASDIVEVRFTSASGSRLSTVSSFQGWRVSD